MRLLRTLLLGLATTSCSGQTPAAHDATPPLDRVITPASDGAGAPDRDRAVADLRAPDAPPPCKGACTAQQICVCGACLPTSTPVVGAESNPTGDPIGGGPGYGKIVQPAQATKIVKTKDELVAALKGATAGNIIYVDDGAELDLVASLVIPAGVTLASGRGRTGSLGALLFTSADPAAKPLLSVTGAKARITGLRIVGPDSEIGDYHTLVKPSAGISTSAPETEIDNCELSGWGYAAVALTAGATTAHVHHSLLHHNRSDGLGYGVVIGSDNAAKPADVVIEANLFDFNRHHIASSGWPHSSYEARYNITLDHGNSHGIDRHGTLIPGSWQGGDGGEWTRVHHNTVRDLTQKAFVLRGTPTKGAEVHHNWFAHASAADAILVHSSVTKNVTINDNAYGTATPAATCLPQVKLAATPGSGPAPLTVSFASAGSAFVDGTLTSYSWDFGDGEGASGPQASHAYKQPGVYLASLTVRDNRGVPITAYAPVTVEAAGKASLSFRIKDGTRKVLPGYCFKQVLVDGSIVFEEDVSGPGTWKQVQLDVTGQLAGKTQAQLKVRVICKQAISDSDTQLTALSVLVEDVYLSRGTVNNAHFEGTTDWTYSENGAGWSGGYFSGEVWTGRKAYRLILPYRTTTAAGTWAQVAQTVTLK